MSRAVRFGFNGRCDHKARVTTCCTVILCSAACDARCRLVIMSTSVTPEALPADRQVRYISAFTSVEGRQPQAPHFPCVHSDGRFTDTVC